MGENVNSGEYIIRFNLLTPEFLQEFPISNYPKMLSEVDLFNSLSFISGGRFKFSVEGFGLEVTVKPMFGEDYRPWIIPDSEEFKLRYVKQVGMPSQLFLRDKIGECRKELQQLNEYTKVYTSKNSFFGLQSSLEFFREGRNWALYDSFSLEGKGTITEKLLGLGVDKTRRRYLTEDAQRYLDLLGKIHKSSEGPNYFEGQTFRECMKSALEVYSVAEDFHR